MNNNELRIAIEKGKSFNTKDEFDTKWITHGIDQKAINYTSKFGLILCDLYFNANKKNYQSGRNALTNSQIRNVFGEVKRIQMKLLGNTNDSEWQNVKSAFLLLQPKMAYASGRIQKKNERSVMPKLINVLQYAAIEVKADENGAAKRYLNFVDFLESILAFHKSFGGRDN